MRKPTPVTTMSMITVSGDDIVVVVHRGHCAGHDCFLTDVKMTKSADLLRLILLAGAFLETPNQQHQREHFDFVALPSRLHRGHPAATGSRSRGTARPRDLSMLRPKFMQITNSKVNSRSLMIELRKNIQVGVALY